MDVLRPLTPERTVDILCGPSEIPSEIVNITMERLAHKEPIVDIDRFSEVAVALQRPSAFIALEGGQRVLASPEDAMQQTKEAMIALGSCSTLMAHLLAGDVGIPRPRKLHEHNQSVLNVYKTILEPQATDPRDRIMPLMFTLQDCGKSLCVAQAELDSTHKSKDQARYNGMVASNLLMHLPGECLDEDGKTAALLLTRQTTLGPALYRHGEKGVPFEEAIRPVEAQWSELRAQCPESYRDRLDVQIMQSYLADAGAHTQRARFIDPRTQEVCLDVTAEDRFNPDGSETNRSLDRIFSEQKEHEGTLTLHLPGHVAILAHLLPDHYGSKQ